MEKNKPLMNHHIAISGTKLARAFILWGAVLCTLHYSETALSQSNSKVDNLVPVLQLLLLTEKDPVPVKVGAVSGQQISSESLSYFSMANVLEDCRTAEMVLPYQRPLNLEVR